MLTNENGRHIHPDKTFFFNGNPTSSRDILISKDEERFCPNILLGLLTGFYGVQKKPWQPEIGDVYFTSRLMKEGIKVLSITKHCLIKTT